MSSLKTAYALLNEVLGNFEKNHQLSEKDVSNLKTAAHEVHGKLKDASKRVQASKKKQGGVV